MKSNCFDIGLMQAFVDGELGLDATGKLVRHVAGCERCALQVAELESENEIAFSALDHELNPLVPTERLREKVFASIRETDAGNRGWWARLVAGLGSAGLTLRPGAAVFASALLIVGLIGGALWFGTSPSANPVDSAAVDQGPKQEIALPEIANAAEIVSPAGNSQKEPELAGNSEAKRPLPWKTLPASRTPGVIAVSSRVRKPAQRPAGLARNARVAPPAVVPVLDAKPNLEAEDGYLRTIATLNRTVNENKDVVLRPRDRVVFERDLAVVNDAIKKMRLEVERNPKNSGAREVLRSSYKNKIELLSSVADRSETVARLD